MLLELLVGALKMDTPIVTIGDGLTSISCGMISRLPQLFFRGFEMSTYMFVWEKYSVLELPWDSPWTWWSCLLGVDLCYYWVHRFAHESSLRERPVLSPNPSSECRLFGRRNKLVRRASSTLGSPLDSVEEVRDRRPLDSVEEVRHRRPLDSVEEVRDRRPLDSVEEVRDRRPLDSVEEVRDRRPLDSVEEPNYASVPSSPSHVDLASHFLSLTTHINLLNPAMELPVEGGGREGGRRNEGEEKEEKDGE
uniref:Uncharacterized protein n=1 Tax=Knipowitschia caucasica TaxID=637954 RepID=A0AAV2MR60_KNICA